MNWSLIFKLSLFGLAMAVATVFWIPSSMEWIFWIIIFSICAYFIATRCSEKYFLHGLLVSIFNSVWITAAHILLYQSYMATHPEMEAMSAGLPLATHPRLMMLITGPVVGVVSGLILGLFAFIASRMVKKEPA